MMNKYYPDHLITHMFSYVTRNRRQMWEALNVIVRNDVEKLEQLNLTDVLVLEDLIKHLHNEKRYNVYVMNYLQNQMILKGIFYVV